MKKSDFTEKLSHYYPAISAKELKECMFLFRKDLIMSLSNQQSSLPSILNPVYRKNPGIGYGVAISIGGTNGYVSKFYINGKGVILFKNRLFFSIPQVTTKEELFDIITKNALLAGGGKLDNLPIGVGFAYPLMPLIYKGCVDGILTGMTKDRDIKGLVGKKVGEEYQLYLNQKHNLHNPVTIANDTICLLLGAKQAEIAGVVGTGVNFAYWEKRSNIAPLKLSQLPMFSQAEVAVNIESSNFNKIPMTILGQIVDKQSDLPSYALAEKEAGGAYLYQIFNAGKDRIFDFSFPRLNATDELNDILTSAFKFPKNLTHSEKELVRQFSQRIFHRSAQIVAIEIAGVLLKLKRTQGIVPIVMEGGIFWKAKNYSTLINAYLHDILPEVIPSFARLFGSSRRGIAILALSCHL